MAKAKAFIFMLCLVLAGGCAPRLLSENLAQAQCPIPHAKCSLLSSLEEGMQSFAGGITDMVSGEDALAYYYLALLKKTEGARNSAIENYTRVIAHDPEAAAAYVNRGVLKAEKNDLEEALKDLDRAIELAPQGARAYYNRGILKAKQGDLDGALKAYDQAIARNPQFAPSYVNRGFLRWKKGDLNGALGDCDKAIAIDSNYSLAYYNRGNFKALKNELDSAMEDYTKAAASPYSREIDTSIMQHDQERVRGRAYYNRGLLKYKKGDPVGGRADVVWGDSILPPW